MYIFYVLVLFQEDNKGNGWDVLRDIYIYLLLFVKIKVLLNTRIQLLCKNLFSKRFRFAFFLFDSFFSLMPRNQSIMRDLFFFVNQRG